MSLPLSKYEVVFEQRRNHSELVTFHGLVQHRWSVISTLKLEHEEAVCNHRQSVFS
jgi:hypothetical protein